MVVGIRNVRNAQERNDVMLESALGGRDYSQRPEFYVPYDVAYQPKALARAKPLSMFTARYPIMAADAAALLGKHGVVADEALFLPVVHRQDWVAVLDRSARILGFCRAMGFKCRTERINAAVGVIFQRWTGEFSDCIHQSRVWQLVVAKCSTEAKYVRHPALRRTVASAGLVRTAAFLV